MKKDYIRKIRGYSDFKKICSFYECKAQYPGWTGTEKYIVISYLTRDEINSMFPEIVKAISPYILLSANAERAFLDYKQNGMKYHWRAVNVESGLGFDEETEYHNSSLINDHFETDLIRKHVIQEIMSKLTDVQRRRISMRYFEGFSLSEIAKAEHTSIPAIAKSISGALEKIKKMYEEG